MRKPVLITLVVFVVGIASTIYLFNNHSSQDNPKPTLISGSAKVPTEQQATAYINSHKLLKEVTNTEFSPIRFIGRGTGGGGFMKVQGLDSQNKEKAYWLGFDQNQKIEVINSTLLTDGLSEEQIRSLLKQKGITDIKKMFLAPTDLKNPPKWRIAWYVGYTQGDRGNNVILDFKTGEKLSDSSF